MSYTKGDILMFDINSKDAEIFRLMNYTPYIFDRNTRVLFVVDQRGLKLYKKLKKHIEKMEGENE